MISVKYDDALPAATALTLAVTGRLLPDDSTWPDGAVYWTPRPLTLLSVTRPPCDRMLVAVVRSVPSSELINEFRAAK